MIAYTPGDLQRIKAKDWACLEELGFWLEPRAENQTVDFSVEFGIRWSPDEFVHEASKVQHASSLDQLAPLEIREAIRRKFQKGEAITEHERAATIRRWVASANLLIEDEEKLHSGFSEHWRQVLKHKCMLLFRKLLEEVGHDDQGIFKDMCNGFSLGGQLPESGIFKRRFRPAEMLESDLRASAKRERVALLATIEASGDPVVNEGVLKATTKEVAAGFVEGPIDASTIPEEGTLTRRFGLRQRVDEDRPRIRPIDSYRESLVNSAVAQTEQAPVHSLDVVARTVPCGWTSSVVACANVAWLQSAGTWGPPTNTGLCVKHLASYQLHDYKTQSQLHIYIYTLKSIHR